jgi:small subunit ribosomal protein S10
MREFIKLRLVSFDHRMLDSAVIDLVHTIERLGIYVIGPIPLPNNITRYIVNRSAHVNKKSREQFQKVEHCRLLMLNSSPQVVDALMKFELSPGIGLKIDVSSSEVKND